MSKKIPTPPDPTMYRPVRIEEPEPTYPRCLCEDCVKALNERDVNALYTAHDMTDAYVRGLAAAFAKDNHDRA